jgi:hypothetical protein
VKLRLAPAGANAVAGMVAGAAYLAAQMTFSAALGLDGPWAPLQRIGAMLLGPDAAPPGRVEAVAVVIALFIHLPLSALYGRVIGAGSGLLARDTAGAAALGALLGLLVFGLDFYVIAPSAFPWFLEVRNAATACDHAIFGALCAVLAHSLRGPRESPSALERKGLP